MKPNRKIIIDYVHPPVPIRTYDYVAYVEGTEEYGPYGWGATRRDALYTLRDELHGK